MVSKLRPGEHSISGKWLFDNGFMLTSTKKAKTSLLAATASKKRKKPEGKRKPYNILLLNGGQAFVPPDKWSEFLKHCAYDLDVQVPIFYCEVELDPQTPRALAADLDYLLRDTWVTSEQVVQHTQCLHKTVRRFLPQGKNEAIVLASAPKQKHYQNAPAYKTGVHIVWPNCIVSASWALRIRAAWLADLELQFGIAPHVHRSWSSIVDEGIYRNGLRLPGCSKCQLCSKCHNNEERRTTCDQCYGDGRTYDLTNVYRPKFRLRHNDTVDEKLSDLGDTWTMLQRCAQRRPNSVLRSDFVVPPGEPEIMMNNTARKRDSAGTSPKANSKVAETKKETIGFAEDRKGINRFLRQGQEFDLESTEAKVLIEFIHSSLPAVYEKTLVRKVWCNKSRTQFWVTTQTSFCQNVNRNHNQNTIYFHCSVKEKHIVQKCWCLCATTEGRLSGKQCRFYSSPPIRLPFDVMTTLFPAAMKAGKGSGGTVAKSTLITDNRIATQSSINVADLAAQLLGKCQIALNNRPPLRVMNPKSSLLV